jgi:hypothetical protein
MHVELNVDSENALFVTIANESAGLQCVAGKLSVNMSVANGLIHTQEEERLMINRVEASSAQNIALTRMNETIKNCIPLIRQKTSEDFPGPVGGHFWIKVVFDFEGAVTNSRSKCAHGMFFLELKQGNLIKIVRRD